jgi:DNA-binding response OmpR family regulator/HPt (histidine-containing phosphotransfer) domain-containing protein
MALSTVSSPKVEDVSNRVVVIDDDPAFQKLIESVLNSLGVKPVPFRSGEDALKTTSGRPRGYIIDGLLPGVQGDEVAIQLRKVFKRGELPIVFVSSFFRDKKSHAHLTNTCKVDLVLYKPLTPQELKAGLLSVPGLLPVQPTAEAEPTEEVEIDFSTAFSFEETLGDYLALSEARLEAMRGALSSLAGPGWRPAFKALTTEAHQFRGSGGSYGLAEISRLGGQLEDLLHSLPETEPSSAARARMTGLIEALGLKLASEQSRRAPRESGGEAPLKLMVLDGEGPLASSCLDAADAGMPIRVFGDVQTALTAAFDERPDAVFVATDVQGLEGFDAAERFTVAGLYPVVMMSPRGELEDRRRAQQSGASGFVCRLPDVTSLLWAAGAYVKSKTEHRMLAVDDDRAALGDLALTLAPSRVGVEPCPDGKFLFPLLDRHEPGLVLLDVGKEGERLELLRVLKADARHRSVTTIAAVHKVEQRTAALEAGADLLLMKPWDKRELVLTVRAQLGKTRRVVKQNPIDPLTGIYNANYLREACARGLQLARRGRPLAMALFELDLDHARARGGVFSADEQIIQVAAYLRSAFRASDVPARLESGRFGVLLHDCHRTDADRLLNTHREELSKTLPIRGGVATFPEVTGGADALMKAALEALEMDALPMGDGAVEEVMIAAEPPPLPPELDDEPKTKIGKPDF